MTRGWVGGQRQTLIPVPESLCRLLGLLEESDSFTEGFLIL